MFIRTSLIVANQVDNTGKGVVCEVRPRHLMPIDENGVSADIMVYSSATFSRMNLARLFEPYINSASRDLTEELRRILGVRGNEVGLGRLIQSLDKNLFNQAWERLMRYYQIVTPRQWQWFQDGSYPATREEHMAQVLKDGIYLYIPTDNEPEYMDYVSKIEEEFTPTYGYIQFPKEDGTYTLSENKARIASLYIILLEKTGSDWAATASGRVQQHGILAPLSAMDKHSSPARQQPARALGEAEVRNFTAYVDPLTIADMLDRNNNPAVHRQIVKNILNADQPTNIESIIDRTQYPLGSSKPLSIVKHVSYCAGYRFHYEPFVEHQ